MSIQDTIIAELKEKDLDNIIAIIWIENKYT